MRVNAFIDVASVVTTMSHVKKSDSCELSALDLVSELAFPPSPSHIDNECLNGNFINQIISYTITT